MKLIVNKPWGSYEILDKGNNYLVKRIIVKSKGRLSLQSHEHRSEHWTVVEGIAEVTLEDEKIILKSNEGIFIPKKAKHSLYNDKEKEVVIIEVWYGFQLSEEDIERYQDIYGRV